MPKDSKLIRLVELAQSNLDAIRRAIETNQTEKIAFSANLLKNETDNIFQAVTK